VSIRRTHVSADSVAINSLLSRVMAAADVTPDNPIASCRRCYHPRGMSPCANGCSRTFDRRSIVKVGLGGFLWRAVGPVVLSAQMDPPSMPPQKDDVLVKRGDPGSNPLTVADIPANGQYVSAWPMAPASKIVRSGSRLNEVLVIRLDPKNLVGASQADSVDGILAYSALCPHAGCNLTMWAPEEGTLSCDCHSSAFDARASGKVIDGPASRPLPPLALKLAGDVLVVARPFATSIRFDE
jgi:Rieske Fe-S protein